MTSGSSPSTASPKVAATYLFDRKAKQLTELYISRPELVGAPGAHAIPVEIKVARWLTLPSYLDSRPAGADKNGDGRGRQACAHGALSCTAAPGARDGYG